MGVHLLGPMNLLKNPMYVLSIFLFGISVFGWGFLKQGSPMGNRIRPTTASSTESEPVRSPSISRESRPDPRGMTWGKRLRDTALGIDYLGCWGYDLEGKAVGCDAIHGDYSCQSSQPVLCVRVDGRARPPYDVQYPSRDNRPQYGGWLEGEAAITAPVKGTLLTSREQADKICTESLGEGWRMAEHHDGRYMEGMNARQYHGTSWNRQQTLRGEWNFYAASNGIPANIRFWVAIDDQKANCWD